MLYVRLIAALLAVPLAETAATPEALRLAKQAVQAERAGRIVEAYMLYAEAAAADRDNPDYWLKAQSLRPAATMLNERRLHALGDPVTAEDISKRESAKTEEARSSLTRKELEDLDRMAAVPRLRPIEGTRDFHLKADGKALFENISAAYGYTVIFDKDYVPGPVVRFDVDRVGYIAALHALEQATNSFIVPLSPNVMLVAQDTAQKRTELEGNEAMAIPIPQRTSVQDAQELMTMIQQTLEIRRVALDPVKRLIYVRDRASKVELASALMSQLSGSKPQVSVEVEFLSVGANSSLRFGLTLPTRFPLVDFGSVLRSKPSIPAGFMKFLTFGAGRTFMGLGITDAQLFATATRSQASSILRSELKASDGMPATMHIGDKYPIVTSQYIGTGGITGGGTTYAVVSSNSFADITASAVSTTGTMKMVVNGRAIPFTIPAGGNSVSGLENIINSLGLGIGAATIQRGTRERPYSVLVVASSLGINSIQLYDDPDGANIALLKTPGTVSAITRRNFRDADNTKVSEAGVFSLTVGSTAHSITLDDATNNLKGLRDAINKAGAQVTAAVLSTNLAPNPFYIQVVATSANSGAIQLYDDPAGANVPLLGQTDEVSAGSASGQQVSGRSTSLGQTYTPPPTFNFEDLGLVLKITPFVHSMEEVTLEIEAEFKVLGSGSFNGVPVISARKYGGKVRLRTSEYAIVAGLISETQARALSGIAGLSQIPGLGALFRENTNTRDTSEVLLVIKPVVTTVPPSETETRTLWFGSELKPLTIL